MNIIQKLTLRHMKVNKRRTLVTILGIAISVAMITAVSAVGYSVLDYMARASLENSGYYHVKFGNYVYEDNDEILEELNVSSYTLAQIVGDYAYELDESNNVITSSYFDAIDERNNGANEDAESDGVSMELVQNEKLSAMRILAVDERFFDIMNIDLAKGEYPKSDNEILISSRMMDAYVNTQIGDKIIIGDKEYTVTGFLAEMDYESRNITLPDAWTYAMYTYLDVNTLSEKDIVSGYFFSEGIKDNFDIKVSSLLDKLGDNELLPTYEEAKADGWYYNGVEEAINYSVLQYYGLSQYDNMNQMMDTIKLILVVIIMVGSISLIVNGFTISLSERSRYLGMLASVGATKKQKRSSVYFEGFIEGIISIPLGVLAGLGGIAITFKCIEPLIADLSASDIKLYLVVNWEVIIWAVIFSCLTIFLSAYIPARRASKIAPIDALRQTKDVKISKRTVKTMGLTRRIFGFEGDLALKNLKRNKKRYRVTVFSLFISLTLFISVYSVVFYVKQAYVSEMADINYDIAMSEYFDTSSDEYDIEAIVEKITNDDVASEAYHKLTSTLIDSKYTQSYSRYIAPSLQAGIDINVTDKKSINEKYYEFEKTWYDSYSDQEIIDKFINTQLSVIVMNDEDLKVFLEGIDVSYEEFTKDKHNVILFDHIRQVQYNADGTRNVYEGRLFSENMDKMTAVFTSYGAEELKETTVDYNIYMNCDKLQGMYNSTNYILVSEEAMLEIVDICKVNGFDSRTYIAATDAKKLTALYKAEYNEDDAFDSTYSMEDISEVREIMDNSILLISVFAYGFIVLMTLICVANIVNTISTSLALRKREFAMIKSVGMTDKAFNKMIAYESAFYGIKALLFGLPVGTAVMILVRMVITDGYVMNLGVPWMAYVIAILGVFAVVGVTMLHSARKIKKANVIEALRDENS